MRIFGSLKIDDKLLDSHFRLVFAMSEGTALGADPPKRL